VACALALTAHSMRTNWHSTGIEYWVEIDCDAEPSELDSLLRRVDAVAEIPKSIRAGTSVERVAAP